jgi:hypothetical protein
MTRPLRPLAIALLALLLSAGDAPGQGAARKAPGGAPAAQAAAQPVVKLLSPGRGARRPLRFRVAKGQAGTMILTLRMAMEMALGPNRIPETRVPPMRMTMEYKVTDALPDGAVRYDMVATKVEVLDDPDVPPQVAASVRATSKGLEGFRGSGTITSRGFARDTEIQLPPRLDPQTRQLLEGMRSSLDQLAAPFPEEAVGVGARWQVTTRLEQNGMTIEQVATYELLKLSAEGGTARVTITQSARPQRIQAPGMPAGANVDLVSLKSSGGGELEFRFDRLMPPRSRVKARSESKMRIDAGGEKMDMEMKLSMDMEVGGR